MAGPTQPKVTDEVWDDDRVKSFLDLQPYGDDADFHVLTRAYRGMRLEDFERFLHFFTAAGRNLDAKDGKGRTIWQIMARHCQGAGFIQAREALATEK
ncbi:MAG: PA4642 family protein [Pseudomonadales bacterium]